MAPRNEHLAHKIEHFARTLSRKVRRPRAAHGEQQQQQQSQPPPARVPAGAEPGSDSPRSHLRSDDDAVHSSGEDAETEAIIQAAIADPSNGIRNYWGNYGDDEGLYEGGWKRDEEKKKKKHGEQDKVEQR